MNKGYTIIELLVTIVISTILVGIAFTYYLNTYKHLRQIQSKQELLYQDWIRNKRIQKQVNDADEVIVTNETLVFINKLTQEKDTVIRRKFEN